MQKRENDDGNKNDVKMTVRKCLAKAVFSASSRRRTAVTLHRPPSRLSDAASRGAEHTSFGEEMKDARGEGCVLSACGTAKGSEGQGRVF